MVTEAGGHLWPHSGPPTKEVVEEEKQTGVVVRVLACLSLARTVLFVFGGGWASPEARQERVKERLLAALVFPKQRKLLALLEVKCLDAEFVIA